MSAASRPRSPLSVGSCTITLPLSAGAYVERAPGAVVVVAAGGLVRLSLLPEVAERLGAELVAAGEPHVEVAAGCE